jgi:hypothetical protein
MLNTLGVRSALGEANRRKLSFRNVSNVVVQLLHTIKYSVPAPFSHLANNGYNSDGTALSSEKNTRQVSYQSSFEIFHHFWVFSILFYFYFLI